MLAHPYFGDRAAVKLPVWLVTCKEGVNLLPLYAIFFFFPGVEINQFFIDSTTTKFPCGNSYYPVLSKHHVTEVL